MSSRKNKNCLGLLSSLLGKELFYKQWLELDPVSYICGNQDPSEAVLGPGN